MYEEFKTCCKHKLSKILNIILLFFPKKYIIDMKCAFHQNATLATICDKE